jgi:hypothetical protein
MRSKSNCCQCMCGRGRALRIDWRLRQSRAALSARNPVKALNRLTKRIESLGYHVSVTVADMAA